MGLFGKRVAESKPSEGGNYWLPGQYLVQIDTVKAIESRKGDDLFIVSGENLESSNEKCPVGAACSWVCNLKHEPAPGNVKSFIAAALAMDHDEVDEEVADSVIDPEENPLQGLLVRLTVTIIQTKGKGEDFSKHVWKAVDPELQEQASELRAAAGLPPF